jgi:hypothetical protein
MSSVFMHFFEKKFFYFHIFSGSLARTRPPARQAIKKMARLKHHL